MGLKTHEFLRRERDHIISEWERAIRAGPQPVLLDELALRGKLPEFLNELASWLEDPEKPRTGTFRSLLSRHVVQRLTHAYQLTELIHEFRVLRETLLRLLLQEQIPGRPSHPGRAETGGVRSVIDLARLNAGLDRAISDAVEDFVGERERVRERFVAVLSHDLRAPIGNIQMNAQSMLRPGVTQSDIERSVGRVVRNAQLMNRMVRDLLDLARGRIGGGIPATTSHMDMGEVCRTTVDDMRIKNPGRKLTLDTGRDLWGDWDRDRALQAVENLVANALQYGSDPVAVTANGAAGAVVVAVSNQGAPIPQDGMSKLFDPFQRGDEGASRREGLGLGLYIVSEIMRTHGGSVAVESSQEHGTTFTLRWSRKVSPSALANRV